MKALSFLSLLLPAVQCFTASPQPQSRLAVAASRRFIYRTVKPIQPSPRLPLSTQAAAASDHNPYASPQLDKAALAKYAIAALTSLSLLTISFASLDRLTSLLHTTPSSLPLPLTAFLFYFLSLKSRVFNPLNNARPVRSKATTEEPSAGFRDRVMPSWTPPGVVFPIMWLLIIGPLRAYSSALVARAANRFLCWPILAFVTHLTIGDVWNTVNNTERRYGAAVVGVLMALASAVNASIRYYGVLPLAGRLLGLTCLWLSVASLLIADTWRLNPVNIGNGERRREPLYPVKGEAETTFLWFTKATDGGASSENSSNDGPGCKQLIDYNGRGKGEEKITYRNREHLLKSKGIQQ
ncbi:hypothetical protein ACHAWO_008824 [Cyclotella atomus]|uniref:Uncharacterized protein n=1 Tax=Cyclotella atomus TaxID=382360 RepID=A0ABD3QKA1_9STRA